MNRKFKVRESYGQRPARRTSAAALQYTPGEDGAPKVVASGHGKIAEQILSMAKENGIPVYEDPVLATALADVKLGEEIPPELYLVVAEVLAYLYRAAGKKFPA
jgi:flagellar biosynthesis protein